VVLDIWVEGWSLLADLNILPAAHLPIPLDPGRSDTAVML
jgi:hypothetical protein